MFKKIKQKWLPICLGLIVVLGAYWFEVTPAPAVDLVNERLNNLMYDIRMRMDLITPLDESNSEVVIIDIDEQSLEEQGRWPWPRKKLALLVEKLREAGAIVIVFDIVFSEPERNIALAILGNESAQKKITPETKKNLQHVSDLFANDEIFAESLKGGDVVLGYIFSNDPKRKVGELRDPLIVLPEDESEAVVVISMPGYVADLKILQNNATSSGFVTTLTDSDGIIRHYPLVIKHGNAIYPSLALATVMEYLLIQNIDFDFEKITGGNIILEKIVLENKPIATDEFGQVLIPYSGKSRTFTYYSASDVINGKTPEKALQNKIVYVGTSAIGLGDLHATPFEAAFPGVEIHATITDTMLSGKFPLEPDWGFGALLLMIFVFGIGFALIAPFLSVAVAIITPLFLIAGITYFNIWLWSAHAIYLSSFTIYIMLALISIVNITYGFLFESRKRSHMQEMFGQYVPPAHVEQMTESEKSYSFEGEARNMSVLFADIRNFTSISEKLSPNQLKHLLNDYFTPMTEIVFENNGTIDKYVGDMIMAFWGAPLENPEHALDAVKAGMKMINKAAQISGQFKSLGIENINIGIGINSGDMNVGDMGSKYRRSYTVLGDSVNLASRLEAATKFYHVDFIISEYTLSQLHNQVYVRHLDRVKVKGKKQPVNIYQPLCMREDVTDALKAETEQHAEALKLYFAADWQHAKATFATLHKQYPNVYIYEMYLERIHQLAVKRIEPGWDGCFVRDEK
jgi:adenylate cyclase